MKMDFFKILLGNYIHHTKLQKEKKIDKRSEYYFEFRLRKIAKGMRKHKAFAY